MLKNVFKKTFIIYFAIMFLITSEASATKPQSPFISTTVTSRSLQVLDNLRELIGISKTCVTEKYGAPQERWEDFAYKYTESNLTFGFNDNNSVFMLSYTGPELIKLSYEDLELQLGIPTKIYKIENTTYVSYDQNIEGPMVFEFKSNKLIDITLYSDKCIENN